MKAHNLRIKLCGFAALLLSCICSHNSLAQTPTPVPANCPANGQVSNCCILNQSGTTYTLTRDLTLTRGDRCFTMASNVQDTIFDLGNHTITYDTAPVTNVLNPSFESAASGNLPANWSLAAAPSATRHNGRGTNSSFYKFGGDYVLKFPVGDYSTAQYIQSDPIRLEPYIQYGVHVLYKSNRNERGRVFFEIPQVAGACATPQVGNAGTETSWGYTYCEFSTASTVDATLRIGVRGGAITTDIDMDMVELRPASPAPVISFSGPNNTTLRNITLRNGAIIQGDGKTFGAVDGSALVSLSRLVGGRIHNLRIIASGTQRTGLAISYSNNVEIDHNEIRGLGTYGRKRDQLMAMIAAQYMNDALSIHDNTIQAFQTGIKFTGGNNNIYNNNIILDSNLSNSYGISVRDDPRGDANNTRIYGNTISGIGRGMHITPSSGLEIYNNHIDLIEYPNPEFWEWTRYDSGHCVQGLKFENGVINAHVHNNYVRTSQVNGTYGGCSLNLNLSQPAGFVSNTIIEDNDFINETYDTAKLTGASVAAYMVEVDNPVNLFIRNNRFSSNSRGTFFLSSVFGFSMSDNTLGFTGPLSNEHFFLHNTTGGNLSRMGNVSFFDTIVSNMNLARPHALGGGAWNYSVGRNVAIKVANQLSQPLAGATVRVTRSSDGAQVFSGTSDSSGYARAALPEYEMAGTGGSYTQSAKSPYSISVTLSGTNQARNLDFRQISSATSTDDYEMLFTFVGGVSGDTQAPAAPSGLQVQ